MDAWCEWCSAEKPSLDDYHLDEIEVVPPATLNPPSSPILDSALAACRLLVSAYADGGRNGGSVDWSGIDDAHTFAQRAILAARRDLKPF